MYAYLKFAVTKIQIKATIAAACKWTNSQLEWNASGECLLKLRNSLRKYTLKQNKHYKSELEHADSRDSLSYIEHRKVPANCSTCLSFNSLTVSLPSTSSPVR